MILPKTYSIYLRLEDFHPPVFSITFVMTILILLRIPYFTEMLFPFRILHEREVYSVDSDEVRRHDLVVRIQIRNPTQNFFQHDLTDSRIAISTDFDQNQERIRNLDRNLEYFELLADNLSDEGICLILRIKN